MRQIQLKGLPNVGGVFLKAFLVAPFRSNTLEADQFTEKNSFVVNHFHINKDLLDAYCRVCCFSAPTNHTIPISYFQTLFIGLIGKYITSRFFPFTPFGLVQISQSFELKRPVHVNETLDLSCSLDRIEKTEKGFESFFLLQVYSQRKVVWKAVSSFLSRTKDAEKKKDRKRKKPAVKAAEIIFIPKDTGRQYARVSKDFNPHHLYGFLGKLFGFKTAIAHGMWTLARSLASLDRQYHLQAPMAVQAFFKLPVFMPAVTTLCHDTMTEDPATQSRIVFELWDEQQLKPHLKGSLMANPLKSPLGAQAGPVLKDRFPGI